MKLFDSQGRPILLGESIGQGGEAVVYRVQGQEARLAKIYRLAPRENYARKLSWMVANPPANPTRSSEHAALAWPVELVFGADRKLAGYTMPFIRRAAPALDVFNPRRRAAVLPAFDRRYLHRSARNLAAALGALHRRGYVAGDLNESNVLVTPSALVTLIDTDSFQVEENGSSGVLVHFCPVGKPEYTPPELQGKALNTVRRLPQHDAFGLGVLVFQLLMDGSHPFRAQWLGSGEPPPIESRILQGAFPYTARTGALVKPPLHAPALDTLHPSVMQLVRRCFADGHANPEARPTPDEWVGALREAEAALVRCEAGHYFSNHLAACPACARGARPVQPRAARIPRGEARQPARAAAQPAAPAKQAQTQQPARSAQSQPQQAYSQPPPTRQAAPQPASAKQAPPQPAPPKQAPARRAAPTFTWSIPAGFGGWRPAPAVSPSGSSPGGSRPGGAAVYRGARPSVYSPSIFGPRSNLRAWIKPRLVRSFTVGGGMGALAGVLPGALAGMIGLSLSEPLALALLFALGGAAGGLLRGYQPGYRLASWIDRHIGWNRFWPGLGLLLGGLAGAAVGLLGYWLVFPIFAGAYAGGKLGLAAGRRLWQAGSRLGWERIWAGAGALGAGWVGWTLAWWVSQLGPGELVTRLLAALTTGAEPNLTLAWAVAGALSGAVGGWVAGSVADLASRLSGLQD